MSKQRLNYMKLAPEAVAALQALEHVNNTGNDFPESLRGLVRLRASQLNGCAYCMGMHAYELRQAHEPETRIEAVARWRESDAFTQRECAALAWTERMTRLNGEEVSDAEYAAAREHFDETEIVDLTMVIAGINAWNRLGVAFLPEWREPGTAKAKSSEPKDSEKKEPEQRPADDRGETRDAVDDDGGKVTEEK